MSESTASQSPEEKETPVIVQPTGDTVAQVTANDLLGGSAEAMPASQDSPPELVQASDEQPEPGETKQPWLCPECGKDFQYRSFLVRHIGKGHRAIADRVLPLVPAAVATARKPKAKAAPDFTDVLQTPVASVNYQLMSEMLFDMGTSTAVLALGPEWKAKTPDERTMVVECLKTYLASKQVKDIPPGMMLAFVLVAYSAPRLREPATSEKLKIGWQWFKFKVVPFLRRKRKAIPVETETA